MRVAGANSDNTPTKPRRIRIRCSKNLVENEQDAPEPAQALRNAALEECLQTNRDAPGTADHRRRDRREYPLERRTHGPLQLRAGHGAYAQIAHYALCVNDEGGGNCSDVI